MRRNLQADRVRHAAGQTPTDDLVDILIRVGGHDRQAFAALYAQTSAKLFAVIIRIVRQHDLAEDVMQNAYLRIWTSAAKYCEERGSPLAWMATIARNLAIDQLRQRAKTALDPNCEMAELEGDDNPLRTVEQNDLRRHLLKCIDLLTPEKREVVLLAYYYGLTGEEISVRLGRPVGTIRTFLHRSVVRLAALQAQAGLSTA